MDMYKKALELLPECCKAKAAEMKDRHVEEFRLRIGQKPTALYSAAEHVLTDQRISELNLLKVLEKATGASLHTAAFALQSGYINYCGLRIGVCGRASVRNGSLFGFRNYSSLTIRIPHQYKGICDSVYRKICREGFMNTLIAAPPGFGKTTALRELIRLASDSGKRISLIDERNEIAACEGNFFQFDVGTHTDVISELPKKEAAFLLLRGMNPEIIAMDEISRKEDLLSAIEISSCGVKLLATVHSSGKTELMKSTLYRELLQAGIFTYLVTIEMNGSNRNYQCERLKL